MPVLNGVVEAPLTGPAGAGHPGCRAMVDGKGNGGRGGIQHNSQKCTDEGNAHCHDRGKQSVTRSPPPV